MKLTLIQRLQLTLRGYALSHKQVLREGAEAIAFYIAKCEIHGHYLDYPHKFKAELRCPMCKEATG